MLSFERAGKTARQVCLHAPAAAQENRTCAAQLFERQMLICTLQLPSATCGKGTPAMGDLMRPFPNCRILHAATDHSV